MTNESNTYSKPKVKGSEDVRQLNKYVHSIKMHAKSLGMSPVDFLNTMFMTLCEMNEIALEAAEEKGDDEGLRTPSGRIGMGAILETNGGRIMQIEVRRLDDDEVAKIRAEAEFQEAERAQSEAVH